MAFITLLFPESLSACSARGHSVHRHTLSCMANSRRGTAMHAAVAAHAVRPARAVFLARVVCKHDQDLQVLWWLAAQHVTDGNAYACSANMVFHRRIFVSDSIISKALPFRPRYSLFGSSGHRLGWSYCSIAEVGEARSDGRPFLSGASDAANTSAAISKEVRGNSPRRLLPTPTGRLSRLL